MWSLCFVGVNIVGNMLSKIKAFSNGWPSIDKSTRNNYFFAYRAPQWNSPKNSTKPIANWTPQPMAATTGANYRPMVRFHLIYVFWTFSSFSSRFFMKNFVYDFMKLVFFFIISFCNMNK